MKKKRRIFALVAAFILAFTSAVILPVDSGITYAATNKVNTKKYTITQKISSDGTTQKLVLKAKKGYKVYYTMNGAFTTKKLVKSGKTKTLTLKKSSTLSVYVVKSDTKVTAKKLASKAVKKAAKNYEYAVTPKDPEETEEDGSEENTKTDQTETASSTGTNGSTSSGSTSSGSTSSGSTSSGSTSSGSTSSGSTSSGSTSSGNTGSSTDGGNTGGSTDGENTGRSTDGGNTGGSTDGGNTGGSTDSGSTTPAEPEITTPTGSTAIKVTSKDSSAYTVDISDNITTVAITAAGTYNLSGGTASEPVTDTVITINPEQNEITEDVTLIFDNLYIYDKNLKTDQPIININGNISKVNVVLNGSNTFVGASSYSSAPAAGIIYASDNGTTVIFSAENEQDSLTIVDSMDKATSFGDSDPSDGISVKGTVTFESGNYSITSNGSCLKGTGKKGKGGINISGGSFRLYSYNSNALKSKNGNINISGGTVQSVYSADDAINAKNYNVNITGGTITIDHCYGDGIQGENITVSGDTTKLDITTYYENAGINYYDTSLAAYNTLTSTNSTKTEVIKIDTGSHKGIKAGTKAKTYSYKSVEDGSDYTAGQQYTQEASGGLMISGGEIKIDTTNTGIKYNSGGGMGGFPGQGNSSSGTQTVADDGKVIIGAPEDGIKSNNTLSITGGTIAIYSSDDGISCESEMSITGTADVTIYTAYEGIEAGTITVGDTQGSEPSVVIYSNDDGINASSKEQTYIYDDEEEETYTKTSVSNSNNTFTVNSGFVNVMIADDTTHSLTVPNSDGTNTSVTFTADGDGIDCNGSFYANGGTVVVYGAASNDNSPIDCDGTYYIGTNATVLAVGSNGMVENPTNTTTAHYVMYGSNGSMNPGGQGGFNPGGQGGFNPGGQDGMNPGEAQGTSTGTITAGTTVAILDENQNVLTCFTAPKGISYILYASDKISSGTSYTVSTGGTVSGVANKSSYDYRGTDYDTNGATTLATLTAQ